MLRGFGVTKYEQPLAEQAAYSALSPTELERVVQREIRWRGRPEWAIREEMERAVARRLALGRRRRTAA